MLQILDVFGANLSSLEKNEICHDAKVLTAKEEDDLLLAIQA